MKQTSLPLPSCLLRSALGLILALVGCLSPHVALADETADELHDAAATGMVVKDGMSQPMVSYSDVNAAGYTNENSKIWRFAVYVETDYDTDLDGKCDLVKAYVQVPRAAVQNGAYQAPVIFNPDPYSAGMSRGGSSFKFSEPALDDESLMDRPAHRTVSASTTTTELALATTFENPDNWTQSYDYFLVRGYAVVQAAGLGTFGSEGLECCGTVMERDAFVNIVEWLHGNTSRHAFADAAGTTEIRADWSSGKVGMIGLSYPASMCFEVATSGVEGLETIVPLAGPASNYDSNNRQGISTQSILSYNYLTIQGDACASRFFAANNPDPELVTRYQRFRRYVNDAQAALAGDYGSFWAARDWYNKGMQADMHASALIITGLNDENVTTKHFDLMRDTFLASGCEVKALLHQNAHVTLNEDELTYDDAGNTHTSYTDLVVGDHSYLEWLNLWFTRALLGVDNDAASLPSFTVQSNIDGSFYASERWDEDDTVAIRPADADETVVSAGGNSDPSMPDEGPFTGSNSKYAALWSLPATEQLTIAGKSGVHVRAKVDDVGAGDLMMQALLYDVADQPFPGFYVDGNVNVEAAGMRADSPHDYKLVRWVPGQTSRKLVAKGAIDLRNPEAGYTPATATKRAEPIEANTYYDYTIWLDPTYYTVPAGHRLELYIVAEYGYPNFISDETRDATLEKFGLDLSSLMNLRHDYTITIAHDASYASVPIAEEVSYGLASGDGGTWTKGDAGTLGFTWKRSVDDAETFFHFVGVVVDGEAVEDSCYTAKAGSAVVELAPSYLATLAAGEHTVAAQFDDGSGTAATFTIAEQPSTPKKSDPTPTPGDTGDTSNPQPAGAPAPVSHRTSLPQTSDAASAPGMVLLLGAGLLIAARAMRRRA